MVVDEARVLAFWTDIEVLARVACVPVPGDVLVALVARVHEARVLRVVKVVQHHHARVFGAPELVKLVVIALAEGEELLPRGEEVTL